MMDPDQMMEGAARRRKRKTVAFEPVQVTLTSLITGPGITSGIQTVGIDEVVSVSVDGGAAISGVQLAEAIQEWWARRAGVRMDDGVSTKKEDEK
jgi:hypothetical protein